MVNFQSWLSVLAFASAIPATFAHPGEAHDAEKHKREMAAMRSHSALINRGLEACATNPKFLRLKARGAARRAKRAEALRRERQVASHVKVRRDSTYNAEYAALSHNLTTSGYTLNSTPDSLFATYKNVSCSLTPETTEGPYYITGEYYRSDIVESESGVPVHLEIQYIDINTCDVASGIFIEAWHCNATGVYSGVSVSGNGVGTSDPANLNRTFLRGVQATDEDGVAAFDTIFPGHYTGRATHIHLLSHQNGTVLTNGTFTSGTVQSVGQIGFDQTLISAVEETSPYNTNTQSLTDNTSDDILVGASDAGNDPFADYAYLGDDISDGLLAWVHVGFNSSASISVSPGAYFYGTGGVAGSSGMGGGGGGPGGAGPSGGFGGSGAPPGQSGAPQSGGIPAAVPTTIGSAAGASAGASGAGTYGTAVTTQAQSTETAAAAVATAVSSGGAAPAACAPWRL